MEHNHRHHQKRPASLRNLLYAIAINGGMVAFELVFGLMIGSMALISDAIHNLSDMAAMSFSYGAERISRRPANARKTYGYRKIEFIAAFVNSIVLSVVIAFVFWESIWRLLTPPDIPGREMLWIAIVAFAGNGVATLLLQKISARNFNLKSAWLHALQDALFSLAVIIGALLIMGFGWRFVDPLLSMAICLFIAREICRIVRQTVNSLMDAVPPDVDFHAVRSDLLAIKGVAEVNDLHIWQAGSHRTLLSAHLVSAEEAPESAIILRAVQETLFRRYGIDHATIQILPCTAGEMAHCNHCN